MAYVLIFFLAGMVAIFVEFFIPGGVMGTIGAILMAVGVYFAYTEWGTPGLVGGGVAALILGVGSFIASMYIVPRSRLGQMLIQQESTSSDRGYSAVDVSLTELAGKEGVALTDLRPSGVALIDEKRVDVVSSGFMIDKDTRVKVTEVEGYRVEVAAIQESEA